MLFQADGLEDRRRHFRCGGKQVVETLSSLYHGVRVGRVHDLPVADDIVGDDESTGVRQTERPLKIFSVRGFIGVDEDHVERPYSLGCKKRQQVERFAHADIDGPGKVRGGDIFSGNFGMPWVEFKGDELATGGSARAIQIVL